MAVKQRAREPTSGSDASAPVRAVPKTRWGSHRPTVAACCVKLTTKMRTISFRASAPWVILPLWHEYKLRRQQMAGHR
jgi:hypothetical protein